MLIVILGLIPVSQVIQFGTVQRPRLIKYIVFL